LAANAALNDTVLVEELRNFRTIDKNIADVGLKILSRHLWYISDILLGFSFFDNRHDEKTFIQMSGALKKPKETINEFRETKLNIEEKISLPSLISKNTMKFFEIMG